MKTEEFEMYLRSTNLSENTISSYLFAVKQFFGQYDEVTKRGLRDHKIWLIESYKPKTVNLRIRAINCYLEHRKGRNEAAVCPGAAKGLS